jgi:hypothetical protein
MQEHGMYESYDFIPLQRALAGLPELFSDIVEPDKNGLICGTTR